MKIFKYPIAIEQDGLIKLPVPFKPIHVGLDPNGLLCLWGEVNEDAIQADFRICVLMTGQDVPGAKNYVGVRHIGSLQKDWFILHVYLSETQVLSRSAG